MAYQCHRYGGECMGCMDCVGKAEDDGAGAEEDEEEDEACQTGLSRKAFVRATA